MKTAKTLLLIASVAGVATANAQIRITEFAHNMGTSLEFIELTNVGNAAVDMTGWSFDDSSQTPGSEDLSVFGMVAAGESVIIAENTDADAFRTAWGLASSVKVFDGLTNNLGGGDEINIYDAATNLVDRLTYTGSVTGFSRNAPLAELGLNNNANWVQSATGDTFNSYADAFGNIGNPGQYAPVPEPATITVLAVAALAAARKRRK